ncbi:tyrosine-type recombinase/integrase, partial [Flavobacterium restrictum]
MKKLLLKQASYNYLENAFKEWLDILGFVQATVYSLPTAVREFLYYLEQNNVNQINQLNHQHIKDYYSYLISRTNQKQGGALSTNYINHHFWALEKFFEFLHHKGTRNLPEVNLKRLKIQTLEREILTQEEVKELYGIVENQECQTQKQEALNYQDKVLLTIYYGCGLRRSEGININIDDINFDTRVLHVKKGKYS